MKNITIKAVATLLVIIACNSPQNPSYSYYNKAAVAVSITANKQSTSTYKITITGPEMTTIGPNEYSGGQRIELFVPEGNSRKFHFERFNGSGTLTDTGTTITTIGSGLNTVNVTLVSIVSTFDSSKIKLPFVVDDFSDGDSINNFGFYWYYYDDNTGVGPNDRAQIAPESEPSIIRTHFTQKERNAFGDLTDIWMIKIYSFQTGQTNGNKCATMPFTFGEPFEASFCSPGNACYIPFVAIGTYFTPVKDTFWGFNFIPQDSMDLTGVNSIKFSIKSRVNVLPKVTLKVKTANIDNYSIKPGNQLLGDEYGYYGYTFSVNPGAWQEKTIKITDLTLPGKWAHSFSFDISKCTGLAWEILGENLANKSDTLDLDNIILQ